MNYSQILLHQILIMFMVIALGLVCRKANIYQETFVKELGNVLFVVVNPINIFKSFIGQYSPVKAKELWITFALSLLMFVVTIFITRIFFKDDKYCIEHFGTVICNCGFFGVPVIGAVLGSEAIFYMIPYIVINTIAQFTYGTYVFLKDKKQMTFKKIIMNTSVIAFILGVIFFYAQIQLPTVVMDCFNGLCDMMGPMCALIIGSNLAMTNLKALKEDLSTILVCFIRLIVIPVVAMFVFKFVPCSEVIKYTLVITLATPSGSSTTVFARNCNKDSYKAARIVSICTLLTIITMPMMVKLIEIIW